MKRYAILLNGLKGMKIVGRKPINVTVYVGPASTVFNRELCTENYLL